MTTSEWSVPETEVLDAIVSGVTDRQAILATVVGVEGNAYRRPGAKMVITEDSDAVGAVTPGCLEDRVLALGRKVLASGKSHIERFDLTGNDDTWGLGVGCNGVVDILLEPLNSVYQPVAYAHKNGNDIAILTMLNQGETGIKQGSHAFARPTGATDHQNLSFETATTGWSDELFTVLDEPTTELLASDKSDSVSVNIKSGTVQVFIDSVCAPPELVICGSGHDINPVIELAKRIGFNVTVVTFRDIIANDTRFPTADRVQTTAPADIRDSITFDTDTYAVIMSHNFVDDRLALDELLSTPIEYIGMVGSRERFEEMQDAFTAEGRQFSTSELNRIYTPAGLDLGGGTPFHIAQSIIAEVTAIHHGRVPQHLTDRTGPIHKRPSVSQSGNE